MTNIEVIGDRVPVCVPWHIAVCDFSCAMVTDVGVEDRGIAADNYDDRAPSSKCTYPSSRSSPVDASTIDISPEPEVEAG